MGQTGLWRLWLRRKYRLGSSYSTLRVTQNIEHNKNLYPWELNLFQMSFYHPLTQSEKEKETSFSWESERYEVKRYVSDKFIVQQPLEAWSCWSTHILIFTRFQETLCYWSFSGFSLYQTWIKPARGRQLKYKDIVDVDIDVTQVCTSRKYYFFTIRLFETVPISVLHYLIETVCCNLAHQYWESTSSMMEIEENAGPWLVNLTWLMVDYSKFFITIITHYVHICNRLGNAEHALNQHFCSRQP